MFAYGISILIVGFVESSDLQFIFAVRYFVYVISGFVIAFIPIVLILIFILIMLKAQKASNEQRSTLVIDGFIASFLIIVALVIIWGMFNFEQQFWESLISALVNITVYFIAIIFVFICLNLVLHFWPNKRPISVIAILGARVEDSEQIPIILKRRVRYAIQVFNKLTKEEQTQLSFIVTGSQSAAESISEAKAMQRLLLAYHIPKEQIILEEQARTTQENMKYIQRILGASSWQGNLLLITSEFHLVRTQFLAWQQGLSVSLKGAQTPLWLLPFYLVRDLLGFIVLTKGVIVLLLMYLMVRDFFFLLF